MNKKKRKKDKKFYRNR